MRRYAQVSGTLFSLVAVAQLVRAGMRLPVQVAGVAVPVWASACAFVVLSLLAIWAFNSAKDVA